MPEVALGGCCAVLAVVAFPAASGACVVAAVDHGLGASVH